MLQLFKIKLANVFLKKTMENTLAEIAERKSPRRNVRNRTGTVSVDDVRGFSPK
jgi:hypothetical protein